MSMLRSLRRARRVPDIVHLHYAPHAHDVIFGDELAALAEKHPRYRLHLVTTRASRARPESRATFQRVRSSTSSAPTGASARPTRAARRACSRRWKRTGARPASRRLHIERFRAALGGAPADAAGGRVRFARSGREIEADGRTSLLRVAEDAGLNPPHGCRMGICHIVHRHAALRAACATCATTP